MAEYIDRTLLELDTEWSEYYDDFTSYSQSQIQNMPKANVIERSKIDKAIEEISNLHGEYFAVMDKDYKTTHKRFLEPNEVLEILKKNIGE